MKKTLSSTVLLLLASSMPVSCSLPTAASEAPVTREEVLREIQEKVERIQSFLEEEKLGGVLLSRVQNFSWITGGLGRNDIVITSDLGAASILVLRDGRRYLVASHSEVPRLMAEDLKGLGFEPREYWWYEDKGEPDRRLEIIRELARGAEIGTDAACGGLRVVDRGIARLRYVLTEPEVKKYRWLGRQTTEVVESVARGLKPGTSELEMEARASDELLRRGIRPTVLLMAVDERLTGLHHATPTEARLRNYAFVNVCARKWGLIVSIGRFIHVGPVPDSLRARLLASARISALYQAHTRPGAKASDLFDLAKGWYAEAGFAGEWQEHHQGGAIGYAEREWLASQASSEVVQEGQAFAWNPFVKGTLSFDMIIARKDGAENITATPDWPTVPVEISGVTYRMPDILVVP